MESAESGVTEQELSAEELEAQDAAALPDREAMTLIGSDLLPPTLPTPFVDADPILDVDPVKTDDLWIPPVDEAPLPPDVAAEIKPSPDGLLE